MKILVIYVDGDLARNSTTKKSTSGCVIMMSVAAIFWYSHQQDVLAVFSTKLEYILLCIGVKIMLMKRLIHDLGIIRCTNHATEVPVDNQGEMKFAHNKFSICRKKQINVCYHYTRQALNERLIELRYCPTEYMLADIMTNTISWVKLELLVQNIGFLKNQWIQIH